MKRRAALARTEPVREPTSARAVGIAAEPSSAAGQGRWLRSLIGGAIVLGALGFLWLHRGQASGTQLPTLTVHPQSFVQEVGADGHLRAVRSSPLTVPVGAQGPLKIAWTAPDGSRVKEGDAVVRFEPTDFEKKLQDGRADRATAEAKLEKERVLTDAALRGRVRTSQLSRVELEKARQFQDKDPEIFSKNQIIESEIDEHLSTARSEHADATQGIESSLSKHKLDLIGIDRKKAELAVSQAEKGLESLELRAPHAGILVFEPNWQGILPSVGDSVWPGQKIASLPLLEQMEAEVFVLEADAGGLKVGKAARVFVESHPEAVYEAKIKQVDTLAKRPVRDVPVQYFGVVLELDRTEPAFMKPGARVHAALVLESRQALVLPRQAVFDDHGRAIAYRWQADHFEPASVSLGPSSLGRVVIETGLNDGDVVAMIDPTLPAKPQTPKEKRP